MIEEKGPLASSSVDGFLSNLASSSPAPGGGSVAALAGALAAALSSMVCNLTLGKKKYENVQDDIKEMVKKSEKLRKQLTELIDEDTTAFNDVVKAFKMPKETDEQKNKRSEAIQKGYRKAAMVPLKTAQVCNQTLDVAELVAEKGNTNSITDAAVAALMGEAGVFAATLNVKINLGSIKDSSFVEEIREKLSSIESNATKKKERVLSIVNEKM